MEQKDIQFNKGIHRAPSMEAQEGELSECVNLIPKNGELVNVKVPRAEEYNITLRQSEKLLCVHEVEDKSHYITTYNNGLYYWEKNGNEGHDINLSSQSIIQIVAIGNALALIYDQSTLTPMKYLLWNGSSYTVLTQKPTVKLDFKLTGSMHGKTYLNTFKIASITSGSMSGGGAYVDTITDIAFSNYPMGYSSQSEGTDSSGSEIYYIHTQILTTNNLYSEKLRATTTYRITNLYDIDLHITAQTITGSGTYDYVNKESKWVGKNGSMTFEFTSTTRLYITWNSDEQTLSTLPTISVSGKLATNTDGIQLTVKKDDEGDNFGAMMGDLKDFIKVFSYETNRFIFPFYLRYGLKYFDGSVGNLSNPMLFIPNTGIVPQMILSENTDEALVDATVVSFVADLKLKKKTITGYSNWKDIITGIVIGITSPIYYFNEGEEYSDTMIQGKIKSVVTEEAINNYGIFEDESTNQSAVHSLYDYVTVYNGKSILTPPAFTESEYKNNFLKSNVFKQIKEYTWEELEKMTDWVKINDSDIDLKNINTYPVLNDSYNEEYSLFPKGGFCYNNRLNIYDIKILPNTPDVAISPLLQTDSSEQYRCIFYISNMSKQSVLKSEWSTNKPYFKWLYINNANAKKCRVCRYSNGAYSYVDIPLKLHPWMNGSYAVMDNDSIQWQDAISSSDYDPNVTASSNIIYNSNAIYASNASNPFFFPVSGQNKIGTGKIKAVSTAAKALSEGQFGQFPLYAFTTDGIWALSVNEQGQYATSNPVNRDVVNDNADVCQIDDSVIYACSQGLKRLSGSESVLISGAIEGSNTDENVFMSQSSLDSLHKSLSVQDTNTVNDMLQNCNIMYDPAGGRKLHIYPKNATNKIKHFIYDIESGEWTTYVGAESKIKAIVPGYPYSIIQNEDNKLRSYTNLEQNDTMRYGILLTRAMDFGNPFVMKMLCDLRMLYAKNGEDDEGNNAKCQIAVFVSNDRVKWKQLTSLRKHSYKWYRFRIQTAMTDLDALTAVSCLIDTRRDNKLR